MFETGLLRVAPGSSDSVHRLTSATGPECSYTTYFYHPIQVLPVHRTWELLSRPALQHAPSGRLSLPNWLHLLGLEKVSVLGGGME